MRNWLAAQRPEQEAARPQDQPEKPKAQETVAEDTATDSGSDQKLDKKALKKARKEAKRKYKAEKKALRNAMKEAKKAEKEARKAQEVSGQTMETEVTIQECNPAPPVEEEAPAVEVREIDPVALYFTNQLMDIFCLDESKRDQVLAFVTAKGKDTIEELTNLFLDEMLGKL